MQLESHTDKLINYIRFWQAMGESEKPSIRVKMRQQQITAQGIWRGGLSLMAIRAYTRSHRKEKTYAVFVRLIFDHPNAPMTRKRC